ncbi:MAG: nuclear transport factor 2 family protein [Pseudomonadota bacterium]
MSDDFDAFFEDLRQPAARAFVRGDAQPVLALSARKGPATFFDPNGGLTEGAEAINQANLQSAARFGPRGTTDLDVKDRCATGELAFWTGYQDAHVEIDGTLQPMCLRVTEVFRRIDGEWRLVHRHASKASDAEV